VTRFMLLSLVVVGMIVKVRKKLTGDTDPGWYAHPAGTVAIEATADEVARDGLKV
jgi:hypothetical protein